QARLHLGDHALVDHPGADQVPAAFRVQTAEEGVGVVAVTQDAGGVGQQHKLFGAEVGGDRGGGSVGVDVEPTAGVIQRHRGDHRHHAGGTKVLDQCGVHAGDSADAAEVDPVAAGTVQEELVAVQVLE